MSSFPPPPIPVTIPKVIDSLKLAFPYIKHKVLKTIVADVLMTGHIDHKYWSTVQGLHIMRMTGIHWQVGRLLGAVITRSGCTDAEFLAEYDASKLSGINISTRQIPEWVEARKRRRQVAALPQPPTT